MVKFFFVLLRIEHLDAVPVKIVESLAFIGCQFDAAEFFIAQIIDANSKLSRFFVEQDRQKIRFVFHALKISAFAFAALAFRFIILT